MESWGVGMELMFGVEGMLMWCQDLEIVVGQALLGRGPGALGLTS